MGRRQEIKDAFLLEADLSSLDANHQLARVLEVKGVHIKCMCMGGVEVMAFLPARFRNVLWLRRGAIVLLSRQDEQSYAIEQVLAADQVKQLVKAGRMSEELLPAWQRSEEEEKESSEESEEEKEEESEEEKEEKSDEEMFS